MADLLAEPAEDAEELAREILRALNLYRAEEPLYVRVVVEPTGSAVVYGPYPHAVQAWEDDISGGTSRQGGKLYVFGLVPPFGQGHDAAAILVADRRIPGPGEADGP